MENCTSIADLILSEKSLIGKVDLMCRLKTKVPDIFFDSSVAIKAELLKRFIEEEKLDVDENTMLTACLLYSCKKVNTAQTAEKMQESAIETEKILMKLGFSKEFCAMCKGHNRNWEQDLKKRPEESDLLEVVDQFGGMLVRRPEREGMPIPEILCLLESRNLKGVDNKYLQQFIKFIEKTEQIDRDKPRELNEEDTGIIGSKRMGLRSLDMMGNDVIGIKLSMYEDRYEQYEEDKKNVKKGETAGEINFQELAMSLSDEK